MEMTCLPDIDLTKHFRHHRHPHCAYANNTSQSGLNRQDMQLVTRQEWCVQKHTELATKRDAERSEREEMESRLKIDNEERMRRLATFQELASNRMAIQQQHLGPLMVNLKQSHAELTEAENLQVLHSTLSLDALLTDWYKMHMCCSFYSHAPEIEELAGHHDKMQQVGASLKQ